VVGLAVIYWRKRRARHAADSSSRLELVWWSTWDDGVVWEMVGSRA
jgi:hypothetical protein